VLDLANGISHQYDLLRRDSAVRGSSNYPCGLQAAKSADSLLDELVEI
jgi:hypothetical protein